MTMLRDHPNRHAIHFPRHQAAEFEIRSNQFGKTVYRREKIGIQDVYNMWAEFWGWVLPWGGIALAAYYGVRHLLGA